MLQGLFAAVALAAGLCTQEPKTAPAAETTATLEGRVVDLRGEPVPLASVWIATWQEPDKALARGTCDGEGCFRIGRVAVGEPSVLIAVSTPHRGEAFEACRWLIDTLKKDVAIWKKEVWADGSVSWVEGSVRAVRD